jgi:Txe/YoeB family toxin of Txe-Axe toxin-antitoxin module
MYRLEFTWQAQKDAVLIERAGLKPKALELLNIIKSNPCQTPPRYEKLQGVTDTYSRRIKHL